MNKIQKKKLFKNIQDLPVRVTDWIGSTASIVLHTMFFAITLTLPLFGLRLDTVLLVLTTVVSLEAIYLAIFIQMTVNRNTQSLLDVEEDIDEIQEDIDKIEEEERQEAVEDAKTNQILETIEGRLQNLMNDIEQLKKTTGK